MVISVKKPSTHLYWTSIVGFLAIVLLFVRLNKAQSLDGLTGGIVALVSGLWIVLQIRSALWQSQLAPARPHVPAHLLVNVDKDSHLPDGLAEELSAAAVAQHASPSWLGLGATTLISLGLAGTFFGLTKGLFEALPYLQQAVEPAARQATAALAEQSRPGVELAIEALLGGAKLAFVKSLAGIGLAMIWNFRLLEVRGIETNLRRHLREELDKAYPPITPEGLLARAISEQRAQATRLSAEMEERGKQEAKLLTGIRQDLRVLTGVHRQVGVDLGTVVSAIRGEEGDTLLTLRQEVARLQDTLRDLAEQLPEQIGARAGVSVGAVLQPKLEDLSRVLQALGTTGKEAIGDALKSNMGDEVSELRLALIQVSTALTTLPKQIAAGSQAAAGTLSRASETGARQLSDAAGQVAEQTRAASLSVKDLNGALVATRELVAAIQGGGAELRESFTKVTLPLKGLPKALEDARTGVESAGRAADSSATRLSAAGENAAKHLEKGAAAAATSLTQAGTAAGSALTVSGTRAGEALRSGGSQLAGQVQTAGEVLRDGVATELKTIQGSLHAHSTMQVQIMEVWKAERSAMLSSSEDARVQLDAINVSGKAFAKSVDQLRTACESTVSKLDQVTGDQRKDANKAIEQLLQAVTSFSEALEANKGAIRDASLQSVASTEQITAAAARKVADALVQGADGLKAAMERAEELGDRITEQSSTLARSLQAADTAAAAMKTHGVAMLDSGRDLKAQFVSLTEPFNQVRDSLQQVAPAVQAATSGMETERRALVSLGQLLTEQASLIRAQEQALATRTSELRELHQVLGKQWSGHVGRMTEAHEQVKTAWQQAMRAAAEGLERNAEEVGKYALKVESALGLKGEIAGLQTHLGDLADALGDLNPTLSALGQEVNRLRVGVDGLSEAEI